MSECSVVCLHQRNLLPECSVVCLFFFNLETPILDFFMVFIKTATRSHGRGTKQCLMIMHFIFCFSCTSVPFSCTSVPFSCLHFRITWLWANFQQYQQLYHHHQLRLVSTSTFHLQSCSHVTHWLGLHTVYFMMEGCVFCPSASPIRLSIAHAVLYSFHEESYCCSRRAGLESLKQVWERDRERERERIRTAIFVGHWHLEIERGKYRRTCLNLLLQC